MSVLIAQLSDTHVVDPGAEPEPWTQVVDCNERLARAVASLGAESVAPDYVLLTGDLVNAASPESMAVLAQLLAPIEAPVLALPGNHDDRDLFRQAFTMPWPASHRRHLSWAVDLGPLVMIGLDTLDPPSDGGRFDDDRRAWLNAIVAAIGNRPIAIAMHHPPFASGIAEMDGMGLEGAADFADTIAPYPNLTRIFCGHLHRPIATTVAGVPAAVGISTVHSVGLDLAPNAVAVAVDEPHGYQLHRFDAETGAWLTHTRYLGTD